MPFPDKVRLALIGFSSHLRQHYLPYILSSGEIELAWVSGYLEEDHSLTSQSNLNCIACPDQAWVKLLATNPVDAVLVSLPNDLHDTPVKYALNLGINVAVDKPLAVNSARCEAALAAAQGRNVVFSVLAQRRFEDAFRQIKLLIQTGMLGEVRLISYLFSHYPKDRINKHWQFSRRLAGGGVLISTGYHAIDTVLWLLSDTEWGTYDVMDVSADSLLEIPDDPSATTDLVETVCVALLRLQAREKVALFNLSLGFEHPRDSVDENLKIFGTKGAIRYMRDRVNTPGKSQGHLIYQAADGQVDEIDTSNWEGKACAPLLDFIQAVTNWKHGRPWKVHSPASESLKTIRAIDSVYTSLSSSQSWKPV